MTVKEVKLPDLGENIESGDVVAVFVSGGDRIEKDQPIIEVESEKASVEIPAPFAGVVKETLVHEGDRVQVGQTILLLEIDGGREKAAQSEAAFDRSASRQSTAEGEEQQQAAGGATHRPGHEPTAAVQQEKELGVVSKAAPPGDRQERDTASQISSDRRDEDDRGVVPAGPAVRRLARELGLDIHRVRGSAPEGRISEDDVKEEARRLIAERPRREGRAAAHRMSTGAASSGEHPRFPDLSRWGEIHREPMGGLRRQAAKTTLMSWRLIPHVTQFDRSDITDLEDQRKALEQEGVKATITAIVIKGAALALRRFPRFNASLDDEEEEIVNRNYVHIGVAVDTERGLVVPVIRDADEKPLAQIALELTQLAEKARTKQLKPDAMSGASFSVTNLGGLGTTYFTPIVTWPQVAVLGVGRGEMEPVFRGGEFVPRRMLPLAVSYDHRLIDGADAARFLRWIAESLETRLPLLLER